MSNDVKIIHRYVPREVGELVVWYLWLALPFAERLEAIYRRQLARKNPSLTRDNGVMQSLGGRLWGSDADGRPYTSPRFRETLRCETQVGLNGQGLNIQDYRHVAIGISRRSLRETNSFMQNRQEYEDDEDKCALADGEGNESRDPEHWLGKIADAQAGHSSHVAAMVYARDLADQPGGDYGASSANPCVQR